MSLNIKTLAQELEEFQNSEEGKLALKKLGEDLVREYGHKERWQEKTAKLLESKTDEELELLYTAYLKHAQKRSHILSNQNIDGESSLNWIIPFDAWNLKIGDTLKSKL